jgi:spore coat polysaccharide biosynthesis protein SpsF
MRIFAIIQARMGSSRLPGKVLADVAGKPMIQHTIEQLKHCRTLSGIVLATSNLEQDRRLIQVAQLCGIDSFAGDEADVLGRYVLAAKAVSADAIVRITGDCPLIDPEIVDRTVQAYVDCQGQYDYVSNTLKRTFPRGLDTEVFSMEALLKAEERAEAPRYREHVTLYMYEHPQQYRLLNIAADERYRGGEFRICVDTAEDLQLIRCIFQELYRPPAFISGKDVVQLLRSRPDLVKINAHVEQKKA